MDSNGGNGKKDSRLAERDREYLESAVSYACDHVKEMGKLMQEYEEIGRLRLFWDGKVPEKNKRIFNHISLKSSDKIAIIKNLKKYHDFFENMMTDMKKLNGDVSMLEIEENDPLTIVYDLKGKLFDMVKAARYDLKNTDSSELHWIHTKFIEKSSILNGVMNRVESIFSREKIKNLTERLDNCQMAMLGAQSSLKEFLNIQGSMEKQIEELLAENEKQRQHHQSQVTLIAKLTEDQEKLLGRYDNKCNRFESLEDLLFKLIEKKD